MSKKGIRRTIAVLLIFGIGYVALTECRPGKPTAFNFWRIEMGMSQSNVEAILGPGVRSGDGKPGNERLIVPGRPAIDVDDIQRWVASDFTRKYLVIGFKDGRVRFLFQDSLGS